MPGFDGTGPMGAGPTGWGRGPCGQGLRRGPGRGFGRGRGLGFRDTAYASNEQALKEEIAELKLELERIKEKLKE